MIHVKADYDDPTSATISIRGLPEGWDGADLRAGFVKALESLLAEANDADEVPDVGPVRVAARKNYEDDAADPASAPTSAPDEPSVFDVEAEQVEADLYVGIGEDAVRVGTVTGIRVDGKPEDRLLSVSFENADGSGWGTFVAPSDRVAMTCDCGCDDEGQDDDDDDDEVDDGPVLRVGSALAGLGLRKVEDVDPVDIADAAFPDDVHLNAALVKLLRLAELRMQYAAAGRKVSGRMDMQKLWDLDRDIARARRETWTRIGKEEKEYE